MIEIPISPLELDPLTRSYWGQWDAYSIGQLAPLAKNQCYKPKFYKAPASQDELIGCLPGGARSDFEFAGLIDFRFLFFLPW